MVARYKSHTKDTKFIQSVAMSSPVGVYLSDTLVSYKITTRSVWLVRDIHEVSSPLGYTERYTNRNALSIVFKFLTGDAI